MVHGITIQYQHQAVKKIGSCGLPGQTMKFRPGDYVTGVKIRANKHVISLMLLSNHGLSIGPFGGKRGEEVTVNPPTPGAALCGLMGRAGKHIDALAFRWGPMTK